MRVINGRVHTGCYPGRHDDSEEDGKEEEEEITEVPVNNASVWIEPALSRVNQGFTVQPDGSLKNQADLLCNLMAELTLIPSPLDTDEEDWTVSTSGRPAPLFNEGAGINLMATKREQLGTNLHRYCADRMEQTSLLKMTTAGDCSKAIL